MAKTNGKRNGHARAHVNLDDDGIEILRPQDVFSAFDHIEAAGIRPTVTMLDPWYNKGVGGVVPSDEYDDFIDRLLARACAVSRHVYLWGFPEILGPFVRRIPTGHQLVAWLTWYYKNNPSVIRGWRSAQMTCLHMAEPDATLYPQHFLNSVQLEKLAAGKLRYMPGPTSVIESALNIGFVGRKEQTGHPAQKPLVVFDKLIRMVTTDGDLIFDPMCGSGTSGVVARLRNRRAILSDENAEYVRIAKARLGEDLSGWNDKLDTVGNNRETVTEAPRML
jgi:site-specific DNA-methyltransferase (adenine-specific)